MNPSDSQLDYAPKPAWHHRKRTRLVIVCVLLIGVAASIKWVGPAWRRIKMNYWQRQCLSCDGSNWTIQTPQVPQPQSGTWANFYAIFSPPGRKSDAVVFLHKMHRKDGVTRLVTIEAAAVPPAMTEFIFLTFDVTVISPGSLMREPTLAANSVWRLEIEGDGTSAQTLRYGQLDANDPSHVILVLRTAKRDVTFDGWLGNNDQFVIQPRASSPLHDY